MSKATNIIGGLCALVVALMFACGTVVGVAGVNGCHKIVIERPPGVPPGDAGDDCARACMMLEEAGCPVGSSPRCADVCRNDQAQGVGANLDPGCILRATSLSQIAACGVSCP